MSLKPFFIFLGVEYFIFLSLFMYLFNRTQFIFLKIWILFIYFIAQCVLFGFTGEDFFIVLALASEFPIFFSFFFFFVVKTELGVITGEFNWNNLKFFFYFLVTLLFVCLFVTNFESYKQFTYFNFNHLNNTPQRSDFFFYFFYFFLSNPYIIFYIGILITLVTLILMFFTFQNQILEMIQVTTKANVSWIRTQDTTTQNNHNKSSVFFKI